MPAALSDSANTITPMPASGVSIKAELTSREVSTSEAEPGKPFTNAAVSALVCAIDFYNRFQKCN